jgi:hypothetical protein
MLIVNQAFGQAIMRSEPDRKSRGRPPRGGCILFVVNRTELHPAVSTQRPDLASLVERLDGRPTPAGGGSGGVKTRGELSQAARSRDAEEVQQTLSLRALADRDGRLNPLERTERP